MKKSYGSNDSDDRKDVGLETVLEVPVPEELRNSIYSKDNSWCHMKQWMKSQLGKSSIPVFGCRRTDVQLLLGVIGVPLVPVALTQEPVVCIKNNPTQAFRAVMTESPLPASLAAWEFAHVTDRLEDCLTSVKESLKGFKSLIE